MFEEKCPNLETYGMDISRKESLEKGSVLVSMLCHGHSIGSF